MHLPCALHFHLQHMYDYDEDFQAAVHLLMKLVLRSQILFVLHNTRPLQHMYDYDEDFQAAAVHLLLTLVLRFQALIVLHNHPPPLAAHVRLR